VAEQFGAVCVDGYQALARRGDVDAILMLSRQWFGMLPLLAACDAGKAVYCAAAWDLDPIMANKIKQRVEKSGIAFMAEFSRRQDSATLRLKELVATQLGKPQLLFCHQRFTDDRSHVATPYSKPQDPTMHSLVEMVDWCCYVVGKDPTSVLGSTHIAADGSLKRDYEMMSLDFSQDVPGNGPVVQISYGQYIPSAWSEAVTFRPPPGLQVGCEHGIAFVELPGTLIWFDEAGRHMEPLTSERPTHERLLSQFHSTITSLVQRTSGLRDAYRAVSIVLQSRQSQTLGRSIELNNFD